MQKKNKTQQSSEQTHIRGNFAASILLSARMKNGATPDILQRERSAFLKSIPSLPHNGAVWGMG